MKILDTDLDRPIPQNWKERLRYTREMKEMLGWIWSVLMSVEGKRLTKMIVAVSFLSAICGILMPFTIAFIIKGVAITSKKMAIYSFLCFCLLYVVQLKLSNIQGKIREYTWGENSRHFDSYVLEKFFDKSLGQHLADDSLLNESVLKKGQERVNNIQNGLLIGGFDVVFTLVLSYVALWYLHWVCGLLATGLIFIHILWSLFLNQKVLETTVPLEKIWRRDSRYKFERINQIEKVKTGAKEKEELKEINNRFLAIIGPDRDFWIWFVNQGGWRGFVARCFAMSIIAFGLYEAFKDPLNKIGFLVPLLNWTTNLVQNLWQVGDLEYRINYATPPILSLKKALGRPKGILEAVNPIVLPSNAPCRIELRDVCFSYPDSDQQILNNISFAIEPGEKVALLGKSGLGKTTIMKLLLRYFDPDDGVIEVDGHKLTDICSQSWLKRVGYIPQHVVVWNGTMRDNLLYNLSEEEKSKITDGELWQLMALLQINFGRRLTDGLNTLVGERGFKLSGGEAQRLIVGAAIIKNPRVLIVDEATSSLDASTEKLTWEGMEKVLTEDRSALIITHRLSTIRGCDKFIMLDGDGDGSRIDAITDSFDELLDKSTTFRELAFHQGLGEAV